MNITTALAIHNNRATLDKFSDNGSNVLFNGVPISSDGTSSEPLYITKDSWSTTGSKTFSTPMTKLFIHNTGNADLTFTVNSITITVKSKEKYGNIFDPFTQITITATSTFTANVESLKSGAPLYSAKESFSGSTTTTKNFTSTMYGLDISNDGLSPLTYTVNGITLTLPAGEVAEKYFDAFTQVVITSTVAFRAVAKGSYTASGAPDTTAPTISASPSGGTFNSTQSVTLSSNESATIYYTTNGSTPTTSSSVYSTPISVSVTTTLKFFGRDTAGNSSSVQTLTFTIDTVAPTTTISPAAGTFDSAQTVTLSANENATIYYTLNGSTPTTNSSVYSSPLTINNTTTIKYFARDTAGNSETVKTALYTLDIVDETPPNDVTELSASNITQTGVTLSWQASTSNDVKDYRVDQNWELIHTVTETTCVVADLEPGEEYIFHVKARDTSNNESSGESIIVTTLADEEDVTPPVITASPMAGTYSSAQTVTLTANEPATIYYTIDGSIPTTSSTVYSAPITISTPTIIKYFAVDLASNQGSIYQEIYIVGTLTDTTAPILTTPAAGSFNTTQNIVLTTNESSIIYYALDPTVPTANSMKYTAPIEVAETKKYIFMAINASGLQSSLHYRTYTIDRIAPNPVTNLNYTENGTSVILTWTASTSTDINGYEILDGSDVILGTTTATTFNIVGLAESYNYDFKVRTRDHAGNLSTSVLLPTTTSAKTITSTGYVDDGLILFEENPQNNSIIFNPNDYFVGNEKFTFAFTVKSSNESELMTRYVFGKESESTVRIRRSVDNRFISNFYVGAAHTITAQTTPYTDTEVYYHVVIVRDNPRSLIYVNDALVGTAPSGSENDRNINSSPYQFRLGQLGKNITFKNIAYYNRALTIEELTQNYIAMQ